MEPRSAKGKEKAKDNVDGPSPSEAPSANSEQESLGSRIVSSMAALARDVVAAGPAATSSDLASLASGKAGGHAASSSSSTTTHLATESGWARSGASSSVGGGFRSAAQDGPFGVQFSEKATREEVGAFLESNPGAINAFWDAPAANGQQHPWAAEFVNDGSHVPESGVSSNHHQSEPLDDEQLHEDHNDGEAVRQLLSDPSFVAMTDVYDVEDPIPSSSLFSSTYTEEERHAVEKIRSDLPPAPVHQPIPMDGPLNLLPNFELPSSHGELEEDPIDMDMLQSAAHRDQLLNEWSNVLSSYTDEVWGDLLPTIHEVQEELEEAKRGGILDGKAIARLRMVLNHIQGMSPLNRNSK